MDRHNYLGDTMIPGLVITLVVLILLAAGLIVYEECSRLCTPTSECPKIHQDNPPSYEEAIGDGAPEQ